MTRLGDFSPIGLLLGLLFVLAILLNFHLNKQFQSMLCCRYFKVSKVVYCRCFGLSNWELLQIFWPFLTWQLLGLFFDKKWQICFLIFWSLWSNLDFSYGALDAKVASSASFPSLEFLAVAGPTHDATRPPFDWSETNVTPIPKFRPIQKFDFHPTTISWRSNKLSRHPKV